MSTVETTFRVRLGDPARLRSLLEFLEGTAYRTVHVTGDTVGVTRPEAVTAQLALEELGMYLRIWQKIHPGVEVAIVD